MTRNSARRHGRALVSGSLMAVLGFAAGLLLADPASACSVCFGDPNAPMAEGARAGVLVLLGVVVVVLLGLASLILFWSRRAASLRALDARTAEVEA